MLALRPTLIFLAKYFGWAACFLLATTVFAQTTVGAAVDFTVFSKIANGCEVNGQYSSTPITGLDFGDLIFGAHSVIAPATVTATLTPAGGLSIRCSGGVPITIKLNDGENYTTHRHMAAEGVETLVPYKLYRDAAFANEYEPNVSYSLPYTAGIAISLPIYGRVQLPSSPVPALYQDKIAVTLTW